MTDFFGSSFFRLLAESVDKHTLPSVAVQRGYQIVYLFGKVT